MRHARILLVLLLTISGVQAFGQLTTRVSMGIDLAALPSLHEYLNNNYAPADKKLDQFETAIEFGAEAAWQFDGYDVSADARFLINSYTFDLGNRYIMEYLGVFPSVCVYKRIAGDGYHFRYGCGAGPRFITASETLPFTTTATDYTSTGYGVLFRADGATALSKLMFAYIGADLEYGRIPAPSGGGKTLKENFNSKEVDFNYLLVSFKLGILIHF